MKLVANIQLLPTPEQAGVLRETLERCNNACNWIAEQAWQAKIFRQFNLHKLVYYSVKERFALTAEVVIRSIAKVADAYKVNKGTKPKFRHDAGQPYDSRIFRFKNDTEINLWTTSGRQTITYVCGKHQRDLLKFRKGEVDLLFIRGKWYISCVCDVEEPEIIKTTEVLGIDLGIVNLAVTSRGTIYSGTAIKKNCRRFAHRSKNLQRKKTRSAMRKLVRISGQQARFQTNTNHTVSKAIVTDAERNLLAIGLENLKHIRARIKATKRQRVRLHNWGFNQLQTFISYKAKRKGIPVVFVDPRYTSQECPRCGHVARANRSTQSQFQCVRCNLVGLADHIAAQNISVRARVLINAPMVASCALHNSATSL